MDDLIRLKAGRYMWVHCDLTMFFLREEQKFLENLTVLKNG